MKQRTFRWIYWLIVILGVAYVFLTVNAPQASNPYKLTPQQLVSIQLSFVVPIIGIWALAAYGARRFRVYAEEIKDSPEGAPLVKIANGLMLLVFGLVTSGTLNTGRSYARQAGNIEIFSILATYYQYLIPLLGFGLMYTGAKMLPGRAGKGKKSSLSLLLLFVVLGVAAWMLMLQNPNRNQPVTSLTANSFYMNDILILTTVIVPQAFTWALGIVAGINIAGYVKALKGLIYKKAFARLAAGILTVIGFSVSLQIFNAFVEAMAKLGLQGILVLIYGIVLLYGVGYAIIASGAKKLHKIEQV